MVLPPSLQSSLPAGWLAFTGRELNPLDRYKRFQITFPSSFSGFVLAQGKFHSEPPSRFTSFVHLVGAGEQHRGHLEAERSRRFEVDDQLVLRWRLHRQIGWLLAFQDAVDVTRRAPILIDEIRPVGDQAAIADIKTGVVDDRQSVPSRKRKDQLSMI